MELYFFATGIKHELDFFETQLQCLRAGLPVQEGDKQILYPALSNLQPIRLYRLVFAKQYRDAVIKTLGLDDNRYSMFNAQSFALRKMMNAKPIPKISPSVKGEDIERSHIGIVGIGVKDDVTSHSVLGTHEAL